MKTQMRGISLVEVMVTLVISMVLMAGVINILQSSKRTYNAQSDMALLQENARFAIEFMNNDLRMSGYYGCSGQIPPGVISLTGTNGEGPNNSDVILVTFMDSNQNAFSVTHNSGASPLQEGESTFSTITFPFPVMIRGELYQGDKVIASDCSGSTTYAVNEVTNTTVTLNEGLDRTYDNNGQAFGSQLRRMVTHRYFIGESPNGGFSLYRDSASIDDPLNTNNAEELIGGVENMQIRYGEGIDTNGDDVFDKYRYRICDKIEDRTDDKTCNETSNNVANWENIVSVRITLLVNTITERFDRDPDINTYTLDPENNDVLSDDHRRRAVFTTTVKLRNHYHN